MTVDSYLVVASDPMARRRVGSHQATGSQTVAKMKASQSEKIREIADALVAAGFLTIRAQAKALGLGRSMAWTILKSKHKASGLSAKTISRILSGRNLPPVVRKTILEYVEEKACGGYGHSAKLRRRFITALSAKRVEETERARIMAVTTSVDRRAVNAASYAPSTETDRTTEPVHVTHKFSSSRRARRA
jgi:hypothetical protein